MSALQQPFEEFKALTGVKRIVSFGGWTFSTEHDTYAIFRDGVTPAQRQRFANNVASVSHLDVLHLASSTLTSRSSLPFLLDASLLTLRRIYACSVYCQ